MQSVSLATFAEGVGELTQAAFAKLSPKLAIKKRQWPQRKVRPSSWQTFKVQKRGSESGVRSGEVEAVSGVERAQRIPRAREVRSIPSQEG